MNQRPSHSLAKTHSHSLHHRHLSLVLLTILLTAGLLILLLSTFRQAAANSSAVVAANVDAGIHGFKFHDINGNGEHDPSEPGLADWTIFLEGEGLNRQTKTDPAGRYWFDDLPDGDYFIGEEQQPGWVQTFPPEEFYEVNYVSTEPIEGLDFGNFLEDESGIHGVKFRDINNNGRRDEGEPGIPGWKIFLEGTDGTFKETFTDLQGRYWFMGMEEGAYIVSEGFEEGWTQTFPETGVYQVFYTPGEVLSNLDFGNYADEESGIHGRKFYDFNGNGDQDANEPGIPGWEIRLEDLISGTVTKTLTDDRGDYWFMDVMTGEYKVSEEQRDGWEQTYPIENEGVYAFGYVPSQPMLELDFGNREVEPEGIHGYKFEDKNGNGRWDDDEPGLSGWEIVIVDLQTEGEIVSETAVTNENGEYWFMGLPPGEYAIFEKPQDDWIQTFPPFEAYFIGFVPGEPIHDVNFGNFSPKPGEIFGQKFHDLNGNSEWENNEPVLDNWVIKLWGVGFNGVEISRTTTTNPNGVYSFTELPPGVYMVSEMIQDGWVQTYPQSGFHTVEVTPNSVNDGVDFGNWRPNPGEIHGSKFHDLNGNGQRDNNEPGLPGWTIIIEGPHGFREEMVTDNDGSYWFMELLPGEYHIAEAQQDGWRQTTPDHPIYHHIFLEPGDVVDGVDFGNWQPEPGSVHGVKFHDLNGNGLRDAGEPGLEGWLIIIEGANYANETLTDENGHYWFMDVPPGEYYIGEQQQEGWQQTFPFNGHHFIYLELGDNIHDLNFGNWNPEPSEIHGVKYNDLNGNGERDNNEPGLEGWVIVIEGYDYISETITNENGEYWFMDLQPGYYVLFEEPQNGWYPTNPEEGFQLVELPPNTIKEQVNFGNWQPDPGEIHGSKWHDLNGNGEWDTDEPGLSGWTIVIESDNGLRRETQTDADGNYWFMDLPPGNYYIIEQIPTGWIQTYPFPNIHMIEVDGGDIVDGVNFGNWQPTSGEVHGTKFYDLNGDGRRDANEPGLEGWVIRLIAADGTMQTAATDADGNYWFMDVPPGWYVVAEQHQNGWLQTYPENHVHEIQLGSNQVIDGIDFGNWDPEPGSVHGMKFFDANGDGVRDPNEIGLQDWSILLIGENGYIRHTLTDENGNYWFEEVPPGRYRVKEILTYGWEQTAPANGIHNVYVDIGQVIDGVDFGNTTERERDFCKLHWDLPFTNTVSLETNIFVFNTAPTTRTYNLTLQGLPAGTFGAPADGPDTFDILTPQPITVSPNNVAKVPIRVHYPVSFTNGFPGPAFFDATLNNTDTDNSFGCYAATWPVREIEAQPENGDVNEVPEGEAGVVGFNLVNNEPPGANTFVRTPKVVSYTIHAMTDGEEGNSNAISLNGLPPGSSVVGQLSIPAGGQVNVQVSVEFVSGVEGEATSDILLELDIDNDGTLDVISSAVIVSADPDTPTDPPPIYLPLIVRQEAAGQ